MNFRNFSYLIIISLIVSNIIFVKGTNFIDKSCQSDWYFFSPFTGGTDFVVNHQAAHCLLSGLDLYSVYTDKGENFNSGQFPYGPVTAYMFLPFTLFDKVTAYHLWVICIFLMEIAAFYLLARNFPDKLLFVVTLAAVTYFSYPFQFMLERGNIDHLIYLGIILIFTLYTRQKNALPVALALSIITLIKLYPGIFLLYFIIKREWKIVAWTLLCSVVIVLITSFNGVYPSFVKFIVLYSKEPFVWISNHSIENIFSLVKNYNMLPWMNRAALDMIKVSAGAGLVAYMFWALSPRRRKDTGTVFLEFSLILPIMTLIPSTSHDYNLIIFNFATAAILFYYQQFFSRATPMNKKDYLFMGITIFAVTYLYLPPVLKLPGAFAALRNKIFPVLLYLFIISRMLYGVKAEATND